MNLTESEWLEGEFMMTEFPGVRFYAAGPKQVGQFLEYTGPLRRLSLIDWVAARLKEKVDLIQIGTLTPAGYQAGCQKGGTCIIAFLDPAAADTQDNIQQLSALASQHISKPITFFLSYRGTQTAFEKQLELTTFPNLVMLSPKLKKMWKQGGLDLQKTEEMIQEITLGNRNEFKRYNFVEELR